MVQIQDDPKFDRTIERLAQKITGKLRGRKI